MSPDPGASVHCLNCNAAVSDKYCGRCGQRVEHAIHTVWHFTQEAAEDLTHADSRLWSTILALLFKPGFLTKEFLAGRRVRYLPPLRLYLVLSVLFFLVLGLADQDEKPRVMTVNSDRGDLNFRIVHPDELQEMDTRPGETAEQHAERICNPHYNGPLQRFVVPFIKKGCVKAVEDHGRNIGEIFIHNLARALFIFLPALALVMKLMYWRPPRYYVEHLLFFIHNHAFVFLLLSLLMVVTRFTGATLGDVLSVAVWAYIPYYLFVSMRRVYGQSRFMTLTKLVVVSFAYLFGAAFTLALTGIYSAYSI